MAEHITPMSEDIRRQRRNLLATSCVLCFMKYGGIKITKTTILGSEIEFSDPSVVFVAIWLLWFYFLIRYYQYFVEEGLPKIGLTYVKLITSFSVDKINSIVKKKHPWISSSFSEFETLYKNSESNFFLQLTYADYTVSKGAALPDPIPKIRISIFALWKEMILSFLMMSINYSVMTEYAFPMAFAMITLIYCNLENWPGKLTNLL